MIHQHEARGADQLITNAIAAHVQGQKGKTTRTMVGRGPGSPRANGTEDQQLLSEDPGASNQHWL
jgi:hypothetical protein